MVINIIIPFLIRIFLKNQTRMFLLLINAATFKSKAMDTRNLLVIIFLLPVIRFRTVIFRIVTYKTETYIIVIWKIVTYILVTVINSSVTYKTITVTSSILYTSYILTLYHFFLWYSFIWIPFHRISGFTFYSQVYTSPNKFTRLSFCFTY